MRLPLNFINGSSALKREPEMPYDGPILAGDVSENRTENIEYLRALAAWYREFAEKAGNPTVWGCRIATAEDLERRAAEIQIGTIRKQKSLSHTQEVGSQ